MIKSTVNFHIAYRIEHISTELSDLSSLRNNNKASDVGSTGFEKS